MLLEIDDRIKVSLRSKKCDIVAIAEKYGGGGHKYASGFEIVGFDMKEVESDLVSALKMHI
jgi:nanoRNase/pAp phosphatase (c-di-AMP/oligoRNAs hydrolase)